MNFKKIHQEILRKSSKYSIIKREIEKNGIIKIQKSKLDLFTFITKTIISQQISDKVAQSLWKKFCLFFKTEYPNKNNIINKRLLNNALENLGISQKKKSYIKAFYNDSKKNLIAINEISLFRQSRQTVSIKLASGKKLRPFELDKYKMSKYKKMFKKKVINKYVCEKYWGEIQITIRTMFKNICSFLKL